jgi:hypothetical protein
MAELSLWACDIRDTDPDTENTDHSPDMGFYGPLVNQSEQRILRSHIIKYDITWLLKGRKSKLFWTLI